MKARRSLIARTHIGVSVPAITADESHADNDSADTAETVIQTSDGKTIHMTERKLSEQSSEMQKRGRKKNPCTGCPFWKRLGSGEALKCCHYLLVMNRRRGCSPKECDLELRKKECAALKYNPATGIYVGKKFRISYSGI